MLGHKFLHAQDISSVIKKRKNLNHYVCMYCFNALLFQNDSE